LLDTIPIGKMATANDVANFVEFLASDQALYITGEEILMNGGSSN
jgi:3-oxoacyl-[acyl-carrier protein] reductase